MKQRLQSLSLVGIFLMASLMPVFAGQARAVDTSTKGQGMQISPVLVELNGDKGKSYKIKLNVLNVTTGDLVFSSAVNDFKSKDDTGAPEIILDGSLPPSLSLKSWISPIAPLRLKSKQTQTVEATVNIPADAEPGGHYGVIRFSGKAPELSDTGVALAASAGTLVLVRVNGEAKESLQFADLYTMQDGKPGGWFETGPVTLVEKIKNTGNVHVKPKGPAVIKNMFGQTVGTLDVNPDSANILPDGTRKFEQKYDKKWLFGKYSVSMDLAYGTTGQVLQGKLDFWIIPWKIILVVILLVVGLFFLFRWLLRRYNARIIAKHSGSGRRR